jgi:hypothetical protein
MSSKNNFSVQIYVFSQKGGGFSLENLVIFQTADSKAIKTYPIVMNKGNNKITELCVT